MRSSPRLAGSTAAPFGPPVPGASVRRSIYVRVIRNASDPFLAAFDPPSTQSTQGRRDESHVPAQALVLMNGSFVRDAAHARAARLLSEWRELPVGDRVSRLFVDTLGREPAADELAATTAWLETRAARSGVAAEDIGGNAPLWADLFHALVNLEEFVHVD